MKKNIKQSFSWNLILIFFYFSVYETRIIVLAT